MANGGVNPGERGKPRETSQSASSLNTSFTDKTGRGFAPNRPDSVLELGIEDVLQQPLPENLPKEMFTGPGLLALADLLPVMTAYYDRDVRLQFINKPFAEWLERPRSELLGRTMAEITGEEAWADRKPIVEAVLSGERQFFVGDWLHPARGPVAAQTEYVPWVRPGGHVIGFVCVIQDVTEQRTAERALKESEARFRRIANSAPVMMWVTRKDGSRDFVNDSYIAFTGLSPEQARKADWMEKLHPDDQAYVRAEGMERFKHGEPITFEARFLRHDGEWRWMRSVSQPRFGPDGDFVGYIGVATDITVAKEAELQLKAEVSERTRELGLSEARFRAVFDTVLEVLVLMEPDGTVVELNKKDAPWRAPNSREAIGRKIWDAPTLKIYLEHADLMKKAVKKAASGAIFGQEVRLERTGVPTAHLDVSLQPVYGPDGKIIYLLFEARDITDLKAAQEQLRQSQKMEALGQLTGGIAHDFNNLLTVVVGGLDIIAKRSEEPKLKKYAQNALGAAERGARLTAQLLAFSRVQRLEVRPTSIGWLIQNIRPLLRNVLGPGITKQFEIDDSLVPVMADPTQLEVAILNLAINARDSMPEGGMLTFAARPLTVAGDPELESGDYIELAISDTGSGMPPEVAERAFEPFFTTKEVGKGTGLGLSMVYGMARQSGGTARIESRLGEGTSVKLLFRTAQAGSVENGQETSSDIQSESARQSASVLVIDDDPDVRGFIVAALEEEGYRVRNAVDGAEGLAEVEREKPDLVIVDFIMPGISGAEVANRIRAELPDQPILFVSGYNETEAVKRTAPDAPLLAKPFRADALNRAVKAAIAKSG